MEGTIELAIEISGYNVSPYDYAEIAQGKGEKRILTLDPSFWQALGRALGWGNTEHDYNTYGTSCTYCRWSCRPPYDGLKYCWQTVALRYFELKLTHGDEEQFWKELLST